MSAICRFLGFAGQLYLNGDGTLKNRERQRANKKTKRIEEALDERNAFGVYDPTPYKAVERIRRKEAKL